MIRKKKMAVGLTAGALAARCRYRCAGNGRGNDDADSHPQPQLERAVTASLLPTMQGLAGAGTVTATGFVERRPRHWRPNWAWTRPR